MSCIVHFRKSCFISMPCWLRLYVNICMEWNIVYIFYLHFIIHLWSCFLFLLRNYIFQWTFSHMISLWYKVGVSDRFFHHIKTPLRAQHVNCDGYQNQHKQSSTTIHHVNHNVGQQRQIHAQDTLPQLINVANGVQTFGKMIALRPIEMILKK